MKWGEDFRDSLRTEVHDDTNQASLAALDAEETCLEDTIRASIVEAIRAERLTNLAYPADRWTKAFRAGLERAETIASGATS